MACSIFFIKWTNHEHKRPDILSTLCGTIAASKLSVGHTAMWTLRRQKLEEDGKGFSVVGASPRQSTERPKSHWDANTSASSLGPVYGVPTKGWSHTGSTQIYHASSLQSFRVPTQGQDLRNKMKSRSTTMFCLSYMELRCHWKIMKKCFTA